MSKLLSQAFAVSGTFVVPALVSSVWVTIIGAGGGGCGHGALDPGSGHGGGGSGESAIAVPYLVVPGGSIAVVIGAKGLGGIAGIGTDGGNSSFGLIVVQGGKSCVDYTTRQGGAGGGPQGLQSGIGTTPARTPVYEGPRYLSGGSGGGGGVGAASADGSASFNYPGGLNGGISGGGGGASSPWGIGGAGGTGSNVGFTPATLGLPALPTAYGAAGGGSGRTTNGGTTSNGGDAAGGYCFVQWVA